MPADTRKALDTLFHPASIAIIGASEKTMYGKGILEYLRMFAYPGNIFPINPKRDEVMGLKAYPRVTAVDADIDIALLIVGRKFALSAIQDCARKGVKAVVIITAGFSEADDHGKALEKEIAAAAHRAGMRLIGPNCAGLANIRDRILLAMLREEGRELKSGGVGFVSQSGALMMALAGVARDKEIGLSYIVSTGNECDLDVSDVIDYMVHDSGTRVITAFIEGFKDVHAFSAVADQALEHDKPIIVLKVGRSNLGRKAAASHTGHLTGSDAAYAALFQQKNIIRALDTEDLFETAKIFAAGRTPSAKGVAILTSSGGTGSLTADLCGDLGIDLPEISGPTLKTLLNLEGLLTFGQLGNPADIRGQGMGIIKEVLPPILADERFGVILVCLAFSTVGPGLAQKIVPELIELYQTTDKPMAVLWVGRKKKADIRDRECGFDLLEQAGIPVYDTPMTCLRAVKALIDWTQHKKLFTSPSSSAGNVLSTASTADSAAALLPKKGGALTEFDSKRLLDLYGIPVTREKLAASKDEAKALAADIGFPVALKVMSPQIAHKTDAEVIALNIASDNELEKQYEILMHNAGRHDPAAAIDGVLVQEMAARGTEVILGMSQDDQFGPVIMFGLGGVFVEVMQDVAFRIPPLNRAEARRMIEQVKGCRLLKGVRGAKPADIDALVDAIVRFAALCVDLKDDVAEIDINPLMVFEKGKGVKALDALVIKKDTRL